MVGSLEVTTQLLDEAMRASGGQPNLHDAFHSLTSWTAQRNGKPKEHTPKALW